jgi:hypothetical protein
VVNEIQNADLKAGATKWLDGTAAKRIFFLVSSQWPPTGSFPYRARHVL